MTSAAASSAVSAGEPVAGGSAGTAATSCAGAAAGALARRRAVGRTASGMSAGRPRAAVSELAQDFAYAMELAGLVEEVVRAEHEAAVAILRERVVGEHDDLRRRRPPSPRQRLQHAE